MLKGGVASVLVVVSMAGCSEPEGKPSAPHPHAPAPPAATSGHADLPCTNEMALVGDTCIDRWEAHLIEDGDPGFVHPGNQRPRPGKRYRAHSAPGVKPQGYINRFEAAEACEHAAKRLCTATQWYAACRGPKRTQYPYGNTWLAGRCNTHKPHLPAKLYGQKTPMTYDAHYNNPRLHEAPGFLAPTGQFKDCTNGYGAHDMVGNLHEWVADDVSNGLTERIPLAYGKHMMGPKGNGVFMGGYFSSRGEHGEGCVYTTTNHAPDYHDYSIGFRCCRDALP